MAWMEHGLQISLKRFVLSTEDKMVAGAFGCTTKFMSGTAPLSTIYNTNPTIKIMNLI